MHIGHLWPEAADERLNVLPSALREDCATGEARPLTEMILLDLVIMSGIRQHFILVVFQKSSFSVSDRILSPKLLIKIVD